MITFRHSLLSSAALVAAVALSACANPLGTHQPHFTGKLSGNQEVPATPSTGVGVLDASLDKTTNVLKWTISYSGLTGPVTGGHFHGPAGPGENAGVAVPFSGPLTSAIEGQATLTPAQINDLIAGRWYVNLHTTAYPGGEIRGQVSPRH